MAWGNVYPVYQETVRALRCVELFESEADAQATVDDWNPNNPLDPRSVGLPITLIARSGTVLPRKGIIEFEIQGSTYGLDMDAFNDLANQFLSDEITDVEFAAQCRALFTQAVLSSPANPAPVSE